MRVLNTVWKAHMLLVATCMLRTPYAGADPSINVALKTSFDGAPYLLELLETAALENSTSYFPLLDRIAEGVFAESQSDQDLYEKFVNILKQDGHFESDESLSLFKYALALHAAAPRIEAHYQYYKTTIQPGMMAAQDAACPVWVHLDGQQYCSPAMERAQQPVEISEGELELPFDRSLGESSDLPISVLYADITHPLFGQFHETVSRTAEEGKSIYRVRYRPSVDKARPLFVSGYGAELVLKRTDYIVIDDRDAGEKGDKDQAAVKDDKLEADLKPLTTTELLRLGQKAASYVMSQSSPLDALIDISANFPRHSSAIAKHNTSEPYLTEHFVNREVFVPAGYNVMWMNGLQVEQRNINPYSLLDSLKRERQIIAQLKSVGLTATQAVDLLSHEVLSQAISEEEPDRFDWRDDEEGNEAIIWMNNIEHDKRYESWSKSLRLMLQRLYPGQLPQIRRNIYNLIVPIDLGKLEDLDIVVNVLQAVVKRLMPIRIGLVPAGSSNEAILGTQLSYHIMDSYGVATLMKFFQTLVESKKGLSNLQSSFEEAIKDRQPREGKQSLTYESSVSSDNIPKSIEAAKAYRKRLAIPDEKLAVLMNGVVLARDEAWFDKVSQRLMTDHRSLQLSVYEEKIPEDGSVTDFLLSTASLRRNTLIVPNDSKDVNVLSVAEIVSKFPDSFAALPRIEGGESTLPSEQAHILIVANFNTREGRDILAAAVEFQPKHPEAEIMFINNRGPTEEEGPIGTKLWIAAQNKGALISLAELNEVLNSEDLTESLTQSQQDKMSEFWSSQRPLIHHLGLKDGQSGLWLNGRIIGPFTQEFTVEDFESLFQFEKRTRTAPVTTAITGLSLETIFKNPLDLAKVTSIVARSLKPDVPQGIYESQPPVRIDKFKQWKGDHSLIHIPSKAEPTIQIIAAIDPASEVAQPWVPILKTLSELDGVDVKIYLNPTDKLEELPIKRFYRQVISSAPVFDEQGKLVRPQASFTDIPRETLFNLGMVVPPSWLVAPKQSMYDLDNIKLSSVPSGQNVDAIYELEHILIEGHSREPVKGTPPRGVQLLLGTEPNGHFTDTIIMANLGYFQFKANPGYWHISIKPGRSSKIYNLDSIGAKGYTVQPGDETTSAALLSFQGLTLYPRLSRKPGMGDEDVLESTVAGSAMDYLGKGAAFASSAFSSLGLKKAKTGNADINIFSVASGHLYERMLNIMMVSVMRHTKHTVKFWFIEQFLSPSFKSSLPTLASHYGFDYEMVTYKWPHWLRAQKEKQRVIWGYKILFLDVLFPLNLDKVIFVDADQIVRTDMMELNKIDLGGAPYGFTPMCDSRTEMEGFRFWKQGYWKNYLQGKPYHISALYVVDLKKFRELAAGDRLRQQYHSLSVDPGSLSNLDQDLPNHMQQVLPIHSLPQEWLWCETWCSDESLKDAKTIDLCNNPQTKEPKLDRARRQVPEWTEYDEEIARVLKAARPGEEIFVEGNVQATEQEVEAVKEKKGKVKEKDEL